MDSKHEKVVLQAMACQIHVQPTDLRDRDDESIQTESTAVEQLSAEDDPINWTPRYKFWVMVLISLMSLIANMGILLSAPAAPDILREFGSDNPFYTILLVSIWEIGEAISPLIMGPLSEVFGRRPVYNVCNLLFVILSCGAAMSVSLPMLIAFRCLCGLAIASTALNPCVIGDIYRQDQRGTAISWLGMMPFIGPILGPVVGGYVSDKIGWRWTFWLMAIVMGVLEAVFAFVFKESYIPVIQQCKMKRAHCTDTTLGARSKSFRSKAAFVGLAIVRAPKILLTNPVIIMLSLNWTLALSYMHVIFNSLNVIYTQMYQFSPGAVGLTYLGIGLGMIICVIICSQTVDKYLKSQKKKHGTFRTKDRLPPVVVGNILICAGILWYGWAAEKHVQWIVPILASSLIGAAFVATSIGIQSYIVDAFGIHSASSVAGAIAVRNTVAAVFPLALPKIWDALGFGVGCTVLSACGLAFIPIPIVLSWKAGWFQKWHIMSTRDGSVEKVEPTKGSDDNV